MNSGSKNNNSGNQRGIRQNLYKGGTSIKYCKTERDKRKHIALKIHKDMQRKVMKNLL